MFESVSVTHCFVCACVVLHLAGFPTPESLIGAEADDIRDDAKKQIISLDSAQKACIKTAVTEQSKPAQPIVNTGAYYL